MYRFRIWEEVIERCTLISVAAWVSGWEEFLMGLRVAAQGATPTEAERTAFFVHVTEEAPVVSTKTPFKKRKIVELLSPGSQYDTDIGAKLEDINLELDPTNTVAMLLKEWPLLVHNTRVLETQISTCRVTVLEVNLALETELTSVDFTVAGVSNMLGVKPAGMAAGTVFELLESLERSVERAAEQGLTREHIQLLGVANAMFKDLDTSTKSLKEILGDLTLEVGTFLKPLWDLLLMLSSDPSTPGDKLSSLVGVLGPWSAGSFNGSVDLHDWMNGVIQRVSSLEARGVQNTPASSGNSGGGGLGFSLGRMGISGSSSGTGTTSAFGAGGVQAPSTSGRQVSAAEFAALQQEVQDLKSQADLSSVVLARRFLKAWIR
jgi:hypothetical protein